MARIQGFAELSDHTLFTTASEALALSRRMVSQYSSGARPIPKIGGLALKGFEAEHHTP